jgi:hypothetical protein
VAALSINCFVVFVAVVGAVVFDDECWVAWWAVESLSQSSRMVVANGDLSEKIEEQRCPSGFLPIQIVRKR